MIKIIRSSKIILYDKIKKEVKILRAIILSATTGGGHMRAANAIKNYIIDNELNSVVEILDTLEYINPILNKTITEGYTYLATRTPIVYKAVYNTANNKIVTQLISNINSLISKKLLPLLDFFKPDILITTHPFSTEMASRLKSSGRIKMPILCVMTDYAPHRTWINDNIDGYIVSNDGMINSMKDMGVDEKIIYPYGIPIEDTFYTKRDKNIILKEMGLNPNLPTILIMAGSFGVDNILKIYKDILLLDINFQIIIITGKNQGLYDVLESFIYGEGIDKISEFLMRHKYIRKLKLFNYANSNYWKKKRKFKKSSKIGKKKETRIIYFTNEVDKYMQVADLIITKPGGLTVTEALASNLPMAIFDAIPGQEEENADFLVNNNMAVKIDEANGGVGIIKELLQNREELDSMRESCKTFSKTDSLEKILELIKKKIIIGN